MSYNLKKLGLAVLTAFALNAMVVSGVFASETAHTGGHFTHDAFGEHAIGLDPGQGVGHSLDVSAFGMTVDCEEASGAGTVSSATVTAVTVVPSVSGCTSGESEATVNFNGCTLEMTIRQTDASTKSSPGHLRCPAEKKAEVIRHGECTVTVAEQTNTSAVVYTTTTVNGKHAVTVDVSLTGGTYEKHGACVFIAPFGTGPHTGASITGSVLVAAVDTEGNPVNITATGINGH